MTDRVWSDLHERYRSQDWINKPNLFAETAISYFPKGGHILELGAGQGQDTRYFADHGFTVVSTDIEQTALNLNESKLTPSQKPHVTTQVLDLREEFPFSNETFDAVYAHLSLHYFDHQTTTRIFKEITRILRPGGILAFFVNSTSDPEYNTGTQLEKDFFQIGNTSKRFFDVNSAKAFTEPYFDTILSDAHGETYKDAAKGIHNLIRYIGAKKHD